MVLAKGKVVSWPFIVKTAENNILDDNEGILSCSTSISDFICCIIYLESVLEYQESQG